jgi:hypothetical protein
VGRDIPGFAQGGQAGVGRALRGDPERTGDGTRECQVIIAPLCNACCFGGSHDEPRAASSITNRRFNLPQEPNSRGDPFTEYCKAR